MKKFFAVFIAIMLIASTAWAAGILDKNDQNMNGNWTFWKTVTIKGNTTLEGNLSVTGTVSATTTRSFPLQLVSAYIDATGVVGNDGTTAPGLAATDTVPAIVWAAGENTPVEWTFRVPSDFSSSLTFRLLGSSSAVDTPPEVDWSIIVNEDDTAFASALSQAAVSMGASCNVSNEEVTLTPDATAVSAIGAGDWVTIKVWPTDTGNGTFELKGVEALFTSAN